MSAERVRLVLERHRVGALIRPTFLVMALVFRWEWSYTGAKTEGHLEPTGGSRAVVYQVMALGVHSWSGQMSRSISSCRAT